MADPISLTGTAVGVLSLGIQVCNILYDYVAAIQDRNKELEAASHQIQHLACVFQTLQGLVPKVQSLPQFNASALATLNRCLKDTQDQVLQLQAFLQSLQNAGAESKDLIRKLKDAGRKITYAFHRDQLNCLQDRVTSLTVTVQLAIDTIHLLVSARLSLCPAWPTLSRDIGVSQSAEVSELRSSVESQHRSLKQSLRAVEQAVEKSSIDTCVDALQTHIGTSTATVISAVETATLNAKSNANSVIAEMEANCQALEALLKSQHRVQTDKLTLLVSLEPVNLFSNSACQRR
jgi:chromosome segregation ATPase